MGPYSYSFVIASASNIGCRHAVGAATATSEGCSSIFVRRAVTVRRRRSRCANRCNRRRARKHLYCRRIGSLHNGRLVCVNIVTSFCSGLPKSNRAASHRGLRWLAFCECCSLNGLGYLMSLVLSSGFSVRNAGRRRRLAAVQKIVSRTFRRRLRLSRTLRHTQTYAPPNFLAREDGQGSIRRAQRAAAHR